jgi:hypothetical protein
MSGGQEVFLNICMRSSCFFRSMLLLTVKEGKREREETVVIIGQAQKANGRRMHRDVARKNSIEVRKKAMV